LRKLGVNYLRTGLSWADSFRPNAEAWFDRQMHAIGEFTTTLTLCFTPEHMGIVPHYTSPPKNPADFADFARYIVSRYASQPLNSVEPNVVTEAPESVIRAA
jgi:beta-xylosidase